jgi:phage shock protein A
MTKCTDLPRSVEDDLAEILDKIDEAWGASDLVSTALSDLERSADDFTATMASLRRAARGVSRQLRTVQADVTNLLGQAEKAAMAEVQAAAPPVARAVAGKEASHG